MNNISDITALTQSSLASEASNGTSKKTKVTGKTIGEPKLSKEAAEYYEKLKKKYSNMDFILVSENQKNAARAQAGNYASADKMVVLIDEDKIERMATDENYRKQYEGIITNAASGLSQMASGLASTGANIKGYGMQVKDNGTATYFAVIDRSFVSQRERIEKKAEEKKENKKAAEKKAEKEQWQERLENHKSDKVNQTQEKDIVTVSASSLEELIQKINDIMMAARSDTTQTDSERKIGQGIDYTI